MVWKLHNGHVIPIYPSQPVGHCFYALPHAPPALLHVNQETRELALKTHELVDLAPRPHSSRIFTWNSASAIEKRSIWVDWNKDVLYLTKIYFVGGHGYSPQSIIARLHNDVPDLQKLKHIAIHQTFDELPSHLCSSLPLLDSITIIRKYGLGHVGGVETGDSTRNEKMQMASISSNLAPSWI
jgi:hypothetical protein